VGTIMEYRLREMLAARGQKVVIKEDGKRVDAGKVADPEELLKVYKEGEWNDYHVIVRDNLIVLRINDVEMSELRDYDKARLVTGLLALQVHVGSPMKVQFKDGVTFIWIFKEKELESIHRPFAWNFAFLFHLPDISVFFNR
jgi:hypothetical protein